MAFLGACSFLFSISVLFSLINAFVLSSSCSSVPQSDVVDAEGVVRAGVAVLELVREDLPTSFLVLIKLIE